MEVAAAPAPAAVHELDDELHVPAALTARLLLLADHPAAIAAGLIVGTRDHPALHQEKKNHLPSSALECVIFSDIADGETSLRSAAPRLISRDFHPLDFTALHHDELELLMSGSSCSSSRTTTPRVQQTTQYTNRPAAAIKHRIVTISVSFCVVLIFYFGFVNFAVLQSFIHRFQGAMQITPAVAAGLYDNMPAFVDYEAAEKQFQLPTSNGSKPVGVQLPPKEGAYEGDSATSVIRRKAVLTQPRLPAGLQQVPALKLKETASDMATRATQAIEDRVYYAQRESGELLDEVYHDLNGFKKSYEIMKQNFRIFVYKDGFKPLVHAAKTTGTYASEGLFLERMENEQNGFTVSDPALATMFFLPYSVRQMVEYLQDPHARSMRTVQIYVANYVEAIAAKYPFWNRTRGRDHFFASCHDWAPSSTKNHKELHANAMKVVCHADLTHHFKVHKDVSLPQTLVRENLPHLGLPRILDHAPRPFLAFFAGQMHGPVRPVLVKFWTGKDPLMRIYEVLPKFVAMNMSYTQHMQSSKFCLCVKGFEVNSPRLVESILNGCVPVIISDNFVLPFSNVLDWNKFSITVLEKDIPNLKKILTAVPDATYHAMQGRLKHVRRHFVWLDPLSNALENYDVFHMILHSIWIERPKTLQKMEARAYRNEAFGRSFY
ncbi:unnamed protein product [Sphagnum troendelagicum]